MSSMCAQKNLSATCGPARPVAARLESWTRKSGKPSLTGPFGEWSAGRCPRNWSPGKARSAPRSLSRLPPGPTARPQGYVHKVPKFFFFHSWRRSDVLPCCLFWSDWYATCVGLGASVRPHGLCGSPFFDPTAPGRREHPHRSGGQRGRPGGRLGPRASSAGAQTAPRPPAGPAVGPVSTQWHDAHWHQPRRYYGSDAAEPVAPWL
jgi:hypothetical protein